MYSSSYPRAKLGGLDSSRDPPYRSTRQGKSCGYYVKLVFFFSSLIQSLIIVSLVLFLVYGQPEKSAEEQRVKELEQNFNRLSEINMQLRKDKSELGAKLGAKSGEKAAVEKELAELKTATNKTQLELRKKQSDCEKQLSMARSMLGGCRTTPVQPPVVYNVPNNEVKTLQTLNTQLKLMINLIETNFTQMVQYLSQERDEAIRDRDTHHQDAIDKRRENDLFKEQLNVYSRKCKEDFAHSLDGIKTVTSEFLNKINNLFPHQLTFHLSCPSQAEQMEKIRTSCTNLSSDVENKFQIYLNRVGDKVAEIQALSSRMEVVNTNLNSELKKCERTKTENAAEASKKLELMQKNHDNQMERILKEQNYLRDQRKLQDSIIALKESELTSAKAQLATCKPGPKPAGPMVPPAQNKPSVGVTGAQGRR